MTSLAMAQTQTNKADTTNPKQTQKMSPPTMRAIETAAMTRTMIALTMAKSQEWMKVLTRPQEWMEAP